MLKNWPSMWFCSVYLSRSVVSSESKCKLLTSISEALSNAVSYTGELNAK